MSEVDDAAEFENLCRKLHLILQDEVEYTQAMDYAERIKRIKNSIVAEGEMSYEEGIDLLNDMLDEITEIVTETKETIRINHI